MYTWRLFIYSCFFFFNISTRVELFLCRCSLFRQSISTSYLNCILVLFFSLLCTWLRSISCIVTFQLTCNSSQLPVIYCNLLISLSTGSHRLLISKIPCFLNYTSFLMNNALLGVQLQVNLKKLSSWYRNSCITKVEKKVISAFATSKCMLTCKK